MFHGDKKPHREEVGDHHGHIQCPFQVMYRSSNDMMVISAKQGIDSIYMIVHFCLCFSFFLGKMIFHGLHLHSVCVCVYILNGPSQHNALVVL